MAWHFNTRQPLAYIPESVWDTPINAMVERVVGHCAQLTPRQAADEYTEFHCPYCLALLHILTDRHHKEAS